MSILVGLDLDNTLVRYDALFAAVAEDRGLLPAPVPSAKRALRDALRARPGGEAAWRDLQARVYGLAIARAEPAPGVLSFLASCRAAGVRLCVISHKTPEAVLEGRRIPLREPALVWLEAAGFFVPDRSPLGREDVFFADTRAAKLARIAAAGCDWFVDDLVEVFEAPDFPHQATRALLYDPGGAHERFARATVCRDWAGIGRHLLGGRD